MVFLYRPDVGKVAHHAWRRPARADRIRAATAAVSPHHLLTWPAPGMFFQTNSSIHPGEATVNYAKVSQNVDACRKVMSNVSTGGNCP